MDDLKSVTVRHLRELARKHLGRGHSKLKTKEELVVALAHFVPALAKLALRASSKAAPPEERPAAEEEAAKDDADLDTPAGLKVPPSTRSMEEDTPAIATPLRSPSATQSAPQAVSPSSVEVVSFPPRRRRRAASPVLPAAARPANPSPSDGAGGEAAPKPAGAPKPAPLAEPIIEGFFIAKVAGEDEARRHHLTEDLAERVSPARRGAWGLEEGLGELPVDYGDDTLVLLPRDPHTLFAFWDFSAASRTRAIDGLPSPRAVLRLYEGEHPVRDFDFALESRSYYLHGLLSGRAYRVEVYFVGEDGRSRRLGPSSARVMLPASGPSEDTSVRFMRVPPHSWVAQAPSSEFERAPAPQPVPPREHIVWRREPLPSSHERAPLPPAPAPLEPVQVRAPERAPLPAYIQVTSRMPGSSELTAWTPSPSGRGREGAPS